MLSDKKGDASCFPGGVFEAKPTSRARVTDLPPAEGAHLKNPPFSESVFQSPSIPDP